MRPIKVVTTAGGGVVKGHWGGDMGGYLRQEALSYFCDTRMNASPQS
jgi:hypothetical protein